MRQLMTETYPIQREDINSGNCVTVIKVCNGVRVNLLKVSMVQCLRRQPHEYGSFSKHTFSYAA